MFEISNVFLLKYQITSTDEIIIHHSVQTPETELESGGRSERTQKVTL